MSMAVRPLLPRRYRCGGGDAVAVDILKNHRGGGRFFLEVDAKIHEFGHKLNVRKCKL
jgi:hypothetical protein